MESDRDHIPAVLVATLVVLISSRPAVVSSTVDRLRPSGIERFGTQIIRTGDGALVTRRHMDLHA